MQVDLDNIEELLSISEYGALGTESEVANTVKTAIGETLLAYTRMYRYEDNRDLWRDKAGRYLNFVMSLFRNPDSVICLNYDTILEDVVYNQGRY